LHRLRDLSYAREQELSEAVKSAELTHSRNMVTLGQSVEHIMNDFTILDGLVNDINAATSSLTDRLTRLSNQYEQTSSTKFLINCFFAFVNKGESTDLLKLWQGAASERKMCATITSQLQSLSRRIGDVKGSQDKIDKFAEQLEQGLLEDFSNAYVSADLQLMRECADVLADFNGGGSMIQVFINQHELFMSGDDRILDLAKLEDPKLWEPVADIDGNVENLTEIVEDILGEIEKALAETEVIKKVFSNPSQVLKIFIQRIFAQKIQQQLEMLLQYSDNNGTLVYLRTIYLLYTSINAVNKRLKEFFVKEEVDFNGELSELIEQNFYDILMPFIDNGKYFDLERKNLYEIINALLYRFIELHGKKKDTGILSRFARLDGYKSSDKEKDSINRDSKDRDSYKDSESNTKEGGRFGQFMRKVRLERKNSQGDKRSSERKSNTDYEEFNEKDYQIDFSIIQHILKVISESIQRIIELAPSSDISQNALAVLSILLESTCDSYIAIVLDDCISAASQDVKAEINLNYLTYLLNTSGAITLISTFVKTVIFSMVADSARGQASIMLNDQIIKLENKTNDILRTTADLVSNRVSFILTKQNRKDFFPRDDTAVSASETAVCQEIKVVMHQVFQKARYSLDGVNLEEFLTAIGLAIRELIMNHLKKWTVNAAGAIVLSRDLQLYQEMIDEWSITRLSEAFSILHGIGNLFTAEYVPDQIISNFRLTRPQVLPSLLQGNLSQLKPYVIREYLSKRVDYYSSAINRMVGAVAV
jgi:exocyst complex component 5